MSSPPLESLLQRTSMVGRVRGELIQRIFSLLGITLPASVMRSCLEAESCVDFNGVDGCATLH